ncbi:MAG TPA: hypothetical protein VEC99_10085, partial [Clostridia bacterium]|nr:hypothetical protein [Clostridia bacterium]
TINGSATPDQFHLINGYRIIGLLSTPKYTYRPGVGGYFSNHVVAYVRSLSGPASEKVPQDNAAMHDLALSYKMFCSVTPVGTNYYHPSWINTNGLSTNSLEYLERVALRDNLLSLQANMHDVRLTFRWPLLPTGETGPGRQVYRAIVSGQLLATNDHGYPARGYPSGMTNFLFFFQPRTYITAKP